MRIAHLIFTQASSHQLQKLVNKLSHPNADYYIHVDATQDLTSFALLQTMPRVRFIQQRVKICSGSYSTVQATLNAFEEIIATGIQYSYVNLLSGQDYPLNDASFVHQYFALHQGKQFMEFYSMYDTWQEALPRITKYHLVNLDMRGKYKLEQIINLLMPTRRMPKGLQPVGRSQWCSITLPAVKYILLYLHAHPEVERFFKLTWAPHEFIFQTILYNSNFREQMVNNNLRYTDKSDVKSSFKVQSANDSLASGQSHYLFATKRVSMHTSPIMGDVIDAFPGYTVSA